MALSRTGRENAHPVNHEYRRPGVLKIFTKEITKAPTHSTGTECQAHFPILWAESSFRMLNRTANNNM